VFSVLYELDSKILYGIISPLRGMIGKEQHTVASHIPISLKNSLYLFIYIFSGSAAQCGLWSRPRGFLITHNDAPPSVGLLWTCDQFVAETST
jgi:hypothetical protein